MADATQDIKTPLITARELESLGIMPKGTAYRMVAEGKLPHYIVGCRDRGIRFRVDEVLSALRRPVVSGSGSRRSS